MLLASLDFPKNPHFNPTRGSWAPLDIFVERRFLLWWQNLGRLNIFFNFFDAYICQLRDFSYLCTKFICTFELEYRSSTF